MELFNKPGNCFSEDDKYWAAVRNHDHTYDGKFVYANIKRNRYCHPSCHSKINYEVSIFIWFDTAIKAEESDFLPCKRCKANDPNHISPARRSELVKKIIDDYIIKFHKKPSLDFLSNKVGISKFHLHRTCRLENMTILKYSKMMLKKWQNRNSSGKKNELRNCIQGPGTGEEEQAMEDSIWDFDFGDNIVLDQFLYSSVPSNTQLENVDCSISADVNTADRVISTNDSPDNTQLSNDTFEIIGISEFLSTDMDLSENFSEDVNSLFSPISNDSLFFNSFQN